jgi:hypothetical protein
MARKTSKKSQLWISDYTLSLLLFVVAILIASKIVINSFTTNTVFAELRSDASKISEILVSEGYPPDWNDTGVIRPGLLTGKRLNETKVINAMNMGKTNYSGFRPKLQTRYEYMVVFEQPDGNIIPFNTSLTEAFCAIANYSIAPHFEPATGECDNVSFNFKHTNLVRLDRLVVYNSSIKRMVVYVWN